MTDLIALKKRLMEEGKTVEGELARAEARVAELERGTESRRAIIQDLERRRLKSEARLHQATEALRFYAGLDRFGWLDDHGSHAHAALAALADEDEKPAEPQREGDYL